MKGKVIEFVCYRVWVEDLEGKKSERWLISFLGFGMVILNVELVMVVMDVCRCVCSFCVVVLVLIGSILVGLCLFIFVLGWVFEGYILIRF